MVKIISYDGKWPNLCSGTLILECRGKQFSLKNTLESGGRTYFTNGYSESHVEKGSWVVRKDYLPDELKDLHDYIEYLVNNSIPHGCCGGCL